MDLDPDRDAVRRPSESISFGRLDAWANVVAQGLIARRGTAPEPVPLMVCSPALMLAAALGVLKAGKFYVAVNPMHPAPHLQRVLDELAAPLLLCDCDGKSAVPSGGRALAIEEILQAGASEERPCLELETDRLAYVLYTSGSTGRPRGIAQSQADMLHNVQRHRPLGVGAADCASLISADGFVATVSNPYVALLNGAALAPYSFKDSGVESMFDWMEQAEVTVLYAFPSFLRQLAAAQPSRTHRGLRLAYLGGESVHCADLAAARRLFPAASLSTGLNSSETGLTCLHLISPGAPLPDPVPVGRPVLDVEVAIVDESGDRSAPGEPGEIEIISRHVGPRRWLRHVGAPDSGPLSGGFRTGDRGRIDGDGVVYHLGRVDQMLKVRGFRVEASEVEAIVSRLPGVAEAAAFSVENAGRSELALCVVRAGASEVDAAAVRRALAGELPPAMIPTRVWFVDALPRTANGKLDRRRLGQPAPSALQEPVTRNGSDTLARWSARVDGRSALERRIAEIWGAELEIDEIHDDQDFFSCGGTSLVAVSVIAQLRRELDVQVPLAALFAAPTVAGLAAAIARLQEKAAPQGGRNLEVRPVQDQDLPRICALVNHYIEHTSFNFHTEPQTVQEWSREWSATRARYPWLVASSDGSFAGVAYATRWKNRAAYDWCAETIVYVAPQACGQRVGSTLYRQLLSTLDEQGYRSQIAVITLPNRASAALHESSGFRRVGTLQQVGYKHGAWLDVGFWQRSRPPWPGPEGPPAQIDAAPGAR